MYCMEREREGNSLATGIRVHETVVNQLYIEYI